MLVREPPRKGGRRSLVGVRLALALTLSGLGGGAFQKGAEAAPSISARDHFQNGMEHYQQGRYAAAFLDFRAAYEIKQQPGLLVWLGHSSLRRGDPEAALAYYERYLQEKTDLTQEQRQAVEDSMVEARAKLKPPPPTQGTQSPGNLPPEPIQSAVQQAAQPAAQSATSPVQERRAPSEKPVYRKAWFWATLGVVSAAAATATALALTLPPSGKEVQDPCKDIQCFPLSLRLFY